MKLRELTFVALGVFLSTLAAAAPALSQSQSAAPLTAIGSDRSRALPFHCMSEVRQCTCDSPLDCWSLGRTDLCRGELTCLAGDLCTCSYPAVQLAAPPRAKGCGWLCRLWGKKVEYAGCSTALDGRSHSDIYITTRYRFWSVQGHEANDYVSEGPCL